MSVALLPLSGMAAEPLSIESIAAAYVGSDSYCDAGKRGWRDDPGKPYAQEFTFERCAHRDGRFKYAETNPHARATVNWSDGKQYYRYLEYGRRYQELSFDDASLFGHYRDRSQIYPVFVFGMFTADPRDLIDRAGRARYLQSYALRNALSTPQYSVFERAETLTNSANVRIVWRERLWVLNADRSIVRFERLKDDDVLRFVEITSRQLNRPLADADLWYDAPLFARFSLSNNPLVFVAGLHVAAGMFGALVWGWLLARTPRIEDVLEKRGRLWRLSFWLFGGVAVVLAALAAITSGGGGHPPAIVYVWVLALWCAIAFGLTACFILASYPVALFFRATRSRTSRGG